MNKQIAAFSVAGLLLLTSCGAQTATNSNVSTLDNDNSSSLMLNSNMDTLEVNMNAGSLDSDSVLLNSNADDARLMMNSNMDVEIMSGTVLPTGSSTINY